MKNTGLYYPQLDVLRFLAFLLVLIHHTPFSGIIPGWETVSNYGWIGVDLFLSLSAYLFAKLLFLEYQEKGDIYVGYFYIRRGLRIWPLYLFFFGITLAYSTLLNGWHHTTWIRSLGMLTFTDNLFSVFYGYNLVLLFSAHLWTISYEEQFYLVIPWALRLFYRLHAEVTFKILAGAFLVGTIIRALLIHFEVAHPAIWVLPLTHFESIFGGLILGLGLLDRFLNRLSSWLLLFGGLLALWLVTRLPNLSEIQWGLMLTYPLVGAGVSLLLAASVQDGLGPLSAVLKNKALRYLGKISYGLYVYHILARNISASLVQSLVAPERQLLYPIVQLISTLVITIVIASASYEILEKTFLRMKERFAFVYSRPV